MHARSVALLRLALLLGALLPVRGAARSGDPGRGHYLLAPSALLLRGGEVVVAQREVLLTTGTIGIGDQLDVTIGSASPALRMFGASSLNVALGAKAGLSLGDLLHLAAGFESITFSRVTEGFVFAVATVGSERVNLSAGAAVPTAVVSGSPSFGPAAAYLAGTVGLGRYVALATENWWFPARPQLSVVNAGMVRFTLWRVSLGLGAARIAPLRIPLPWVDLSVRVLG